MEIHFATQTFSDMWFLTGAQSACQVLHVEKAIPVSNIAKRIGTEWTFFQYSLSMLEFCLGWACTVIVHASTITVSSYV